MRKRFPTNERGVSAIIIAILVVVLFGFTALAVDVARAYEERRELQRTADVSALSGAQALLLGEAAAETKGREYVTSNPSVHHPGAYNAGAGDNLDARLGALGCPINGVKYDCVVSHVEAPPYSDDNPDGFRWLFAPVLGIDPSRSIMAEATAVMGAGQPGGEKLVPWMVLDCPDAALSADEGNSLVTTQAQTVNPSCPYTFSTVGFNGPTEELFLSTADSTGGNFQAADFHNELPDPSKCPPPNGFFDHSGGSGAKDYTDFLLGNPTDDVVPCNIGKYARLYGKPGAMPTPTNKALKDRGVESCMTEAAFNASIEHVSGTFYRIKQVNPCMVAILFVVHTNPGAAGLTTTATRGTLSMQHPEAYDANGDGAWRFGPLDKGASKPMLVRRFGFFYLKSLGNANGKQPWRGVFIQVMDSAESGLDGSRCTAGDGLCVVKLVG
jgi:Putative Flp pilus-assembly TadE/G-like